MPSEIEENVPLRNFDNRHRKYATIFKNCDTDNDGFICLRELYSFVNSNCDGTTYIPKHKLRKIEQMADRDGDGRLNENEFIALMEQEDFKRILNQHVNRYIHFLVPQQSPTVLRGGVLRAAPDGEYEEDEDMLIDQYTCCPPPIFFFLISLVQLACFIADEQTEKDSTLTGTGITAKLFIYDPQKKNEIWRYLTYMLVHIGYAHLAMNLAVQLLLGIPLEMVHKWWRVLIIYFAGVIAGCLAHSLTEPHAMLGGASGGVYSIMTAHIANVIMNWGQMLYPYIQLSIFGILVLADLGPAAYERYVLNISTSVGVSAHVGGAIAGLLVGIYTLKNLKITNTEKYIWWAALILYILLMGIAIMINLLNQV